jgi:N-acetylmuramoyl-L-alanine amidase
MSAAIDQSRRQVIQLGCVFGISFILRPLAHADELLDLVSNANQVVAVRIWPSHIYTRITIESTYAIQSAATTGDDSVIVDLANSHLNGILQSMPDKIINSDPIIKGITVKQQDATTVRVKILLKQSVKVQMKTIPPVDLAGVSYQYRYVIDMYPNAKSGVDDSLNDDLLALLQLHSDDVDDNRLIASSVSTPPIYKQSSAKKLLVMLDPGHGGEDPGAIGPTGIREKDVVLDIGQKLYDIINATSYMEAKLTRSQDVFIPLATRVEIGRRAKADVFVSIHADAFTTKLARGASVFILSDGGASSSSAKWLAKTQNDADLIGGMSFKSHDKTTSRVLLDMTQTITSKKSAKLAGAILPNLAKIGQLHNGRIEKAGFAVLKAPDIPSVLVETAFISNPDEESHLKNPDFRQKMAEMIFAGINNCKNGFL